MRRSSALAASAVVGVAAVEAIDRLVRRPGRAVPSAPGGRVVVVLGFPGTHGWSRAVQRWRVEMALRARASLGAERIVFTGGTPYSDESEASQMAAIAVEQGLPRDAVVLEERSRTTWENVGYAEALVDADEVAIVVSDALHARRAADNWIAQFPERSGRVIVDPGYRFGDHLWLKVPSTIGAGISIAKRRLPLPRRAAP